MIFDILDHFDVHVFLFFSELNWDCVFLCFFFNKEIKRLCSGSENIAHACASILMNDTKRT